MSDELRHTRSGPKEPAAPPDNRPQQTHKAYCSAGQPAPCPGYFEGDVLPCVCDARNLLEALSQGALPAVPLDEDDTSDTGDLPLSA
jgi:hypothetical protein